MATFAKQTFNAVNYASFRPTYPQKLFDRLLAYHSGPRGTCIDLGCGTGIVTRSLSPYFDHVLGTDPSSGMIKQAISNSPKDKWPNVDYREAGAEKLEWVQDKSVDMVVAGQSAHWFDFDRFWPEVARIVKKGGTFACWGYKDHIFPDFPKATQILNDYCEAKDSELGKYWPRPGRTYVQEHLRVIQPPPDAWEAVERTEYEPATRGAHSGEGECFLEKRMTVGGCKEYMRTWSSTHGWMEEHPDRQPRTKGGPGDIVDEMVDKMAEEAESEFKDEQSEILVEWGWGMIFARRK